GSTGRRGRVNSCSIPVKNHAGKSLSRYDGSMTTRALVLAGRSRATGALAAGLEVLREHGIEPLVESLGEPAASIRRHRDRIDRIIVAGGDGSVNRALAPVLESGLPLGVVPLGTANDLARTLELPGDASEACGVIAAGHTHRIDVGRVNNHH